MGVCPLRMRCENGIYKEGTVEHNFHASEWCKDEKKKRKNDLYKLLFNLVEFRTKTSLGRK